MQSHADVVLLVCPQILARNTGGLKYGESGHPVYRQQEVKLPFHAVSLPVFTQYNLSLQRNYNSSAV